MRSALARTLAGAALLAATLAPHAAPPDASAPSGPAIVLAAGDPPRLRSLDCASGRETHAASQPPPRGASIVLSPDDDAVFVAAARRLLRLSIPALETQAQASLGFDAMTLAASGGADAAVLAGGAGPIAMSAHDARTLASAHEYRVDDTRSATVSSMLDRPRRSRFVVAFSDLDEVWEIAYARDAPPVLRGLVHDYRMREAVELPGRYTPRAFKVPGPTRALVAGPVAHEVLRIDDAGHLGVLNLDVRREIERPSAAGVPAPERIAAWHGAGTRGWVFADEGSSALRVLEGGAWRWVEPMAVGGVVLAIAALDDGAVLAALARADNISLVRLDVGARSAREAARGASSGATPPYRFVRGTNACVALVDAQGRWVAGVTREMRAAARGRGS